MLRGGASGMPACPPSNPGALGRHLIVTVSSSVGCLEASFERGGDIPVPTAEDRRREEEPLIRRAQEGDLVAFEQLYRDHLGRVFALCRRLAGEASLAEELA